MNLARRTVRSIVPALVVSLCAANAWAQATQKPFEPQSGQAGKDVVWVPTPQTLVDKMLDMAKVTPQDFVIDLGSGDGRTVITAAKRGARAMGIEYNPDMVALSERDAKTAGVTDKATFVKADLFESDFSKATVVTMFLLPSINLKLRPKILDMKPGTRIVANSFNMEDWEADETRDRRRRLHQLVHGAAVDRAGEGPRHLDDAEGRPQADAAVPEGDGHVGDAGRSRKASCAATSSRSRRAAPPTPAKWRAT